MEKTIIDEYVRQASVLPAAIKGLSSAELNARPVSNTWSIRQNVSVHIAYWIA